MINHVPRDPQRIDQVIEILRMVWKKYPDMRFTQLLSNIVGVQITDIQFFNLEDHELAYRTGVFDAYYGRVYDPTAEARPINADPDFPYPGYPDHP